MNKPKAWINGRFVDIDKAKISVFDRGFLYGDGIFETMRSYAGMVFRLDTHLNRLFGALEVMRMRSPYNRKELKDIIYKGLNINRLKNAYIRLTITRGEGRFGIHFKDAFTPNVVIVIKEFGEYPGWMYSRGISAKVVEMAQNERSPLPGIKSLNYLTYILARLYAKEADYDEAILKNTKGYIAEAATSNIFLVKKNILITPSQASGILPGVTRGVVIEIAKGLRLKMQEKLVTYKALLNADEAFLTNSLVEVLPIRSIDHKKVGAGRPCDMTKLLHISYQKQVIKETLNRSVLP